MGATWKRAMAVALALAFSIACQWPMIHTDLLVVVINTIVCVTFVAVGVSLSPDFVGVRWNFAFLSLGLVWPMRWIGCWDSGPWPFLSQWPMGFICIIGGRAMLATSTDPSPLLDRAAKALMWVANPVAQTALIVTSEPEWGGHSPSSWWPGLFASHSNYQAVSLVILCVDLIASAAFTLALFIRVKAMIGLDRMIIAPVYVSCCAFAFSVSWQGGNDLIANPKTGIFYVLATCLFIASPLGLMASVAFRRLENATMSEVLHQLFATSQPDIESIERALRKTLRDSTLNLRLVDPETHALALAPNRMVKEIQAADGRTVAVLEGNIALEHHPSLLMTATHASSVALQNLQLQTDLRAQIVNVEESRVRISMAALEERRRIERDLHDGIQQRLLAVVARLGVVQKQKTPMDLDEVEQVSNDLRETLEDLRNLSHGIMPQELRQFGFKSALDSIVERVPLQISTKVCDFDSSPNLDATLYFVTCELLSNIVKHSNASAVEIDLGKVGGELILQVSDNGSQSDGVKFGSGLLGCDDRVRTLGGELSVVTNEPGLSVQVRLPL